MGKAKEQRTTQTTELPSWLQPAMQRGVERAEGLYQQGAPAPMQITPFSADTQQAFGMMRQNAANGMGMNPAFDQFNATLNGDYLNGPGMDAQMQAATNRIVPQVQGMFARSGRGGSGLAQHAMTSALADAQAGLYSDERQRQMQMMGMAPNMARLSMMPAQQLAAIGSAQEAQQQAVNQQQYQAANADQMSLDNYLQRIQGIAPHAGGTMTSRQPIHRNPLGSLLGAGLSIGGMFMGVPPMATAGASGLLTGGLEF